MATDRTDSWIYDVLLRTSGHVVELGSLTVLRSIHVC